MDPGWMRWKGIWVVVILFLFLVSKTNATMVLIFDGDMSRSERDLLLFG